MVKKCKVDGINKSIDSRAAFVLEKLFCKNEGCLEILDVKKAKNDWLLISFLMHASPVLKGYRNIGIYVNVATDGNKLVVTESHYHVRPESFKVDEAMKDIKNQVDQGFFVEI